MAEKKINHASTLDTSKNVYFSAELFIHRKSGT